MNRLLNRVEPFAALFWALGNVLYTSPHLTLQAGPASLHRRSQSMSLFGHTVGSNLNEDAPATPLFLSVCDLSMLPTLILYALRGTPPALSLWHPPPLPWTCFTTLFLLYLPFKYDV